mgnify:CR=1 FL=1
MKILVISQHYYPENFRITDICETLVVMGHQVDVICGLPNYPEGEVLSDYKHGKNREQVINGVNIHRCFEIGRGKVYKIYDCENNVENLSLLRCPDNESHGQKNCGNNERNGEGFLNDVTAVVGCLIDFGIYDGILHCLCLCQFFLGNI